VTRIVSRFVRSALPFLAILAIGATGAYAQELDSEAAFDAIQQQLRANDKAAAESVAVDLIERLGAASPVDSLVLARAQERLAHVLWSRKSRVPEALALIENSLGIQRRHLGENDPGHRRGMFTKGRVLAEVGNYAGAESTLVHLRSLLDAAGDSLEAAQTDAELGTLLYRVARPREALPYLERAYPLLEATGAPANPEFLRVVYVMGLIHTHVGEERESIPWFEKTLAGYEVAYGPESEPTSYPLIALGAAHSSLAEYEKAEEYLRAGIAIIERHHGPDSPRLSWPLNVWSGMITSRGDYAAARPFLERAVELQRNEPNPYPMSTYLGFLARNSAQLGDAESALEGWHEVLAIREELIHEDRVPVGEVYNQIALLEEEAGDYESALAHFEKASTIYDEAYGTNDFRSGFAYANRASVLARLGRSDAALPLVEKAIAVLETARGPKHPQTAEVEQIFARVLRERHDPDGARDHLGRCLAIRLATRGDEHPSVGSTYADLAEVCADLGRPREAIDFAIRAEDIGREHFRMLASALSERQALQLAASRATGLDCALDLAASHGNAVEPAWNALIASRALVLDEMADRLRTSWITESAVVDSLRDAYAAASRRLAHLLVQGADTDDAGDYRAELDRARAQRERIETDLAGESARYRRIRSAQGADLADVARSLPRDGCLVAFAQYGQDSPSALAFVLEHPKAKPVAIPLGSVARIDDAVSRWRFEASRGPWIAGRTEAQAADAYREAGARLADLVWTPIEDHLGARRVFIVPDGSLHLVNFAALPIGMDRYVLDEDRLLHMASSERDLLPLADEAGTGLLAVGGPTFDDTIGADEPVLLAFRGALADCDAFRDVRFAPLPRSLEESERVAALWRQVDAAEPLVLAGHAASESAVKAGAPGRRFLHFATHGFFLDPQCADPRDSGTRGIAGLKPSRAKLRSGSSRSLRLAGIALAGANDRDGATGEDGILTAEEIATLDLRGVQWAVLSACETGVGDVDAREGIFGLRRAFHLAGARTVVSSLWAVRDEDALAWMDELYRARLVDDLDVAECTTRAARRLLADARAGGRTTHPFTWGGFVAAGDWR